MISVYSLSDNRVLFVFWGIKGLIRDGDALRDELLKAKPERIYVCISQGEVEGLKKFLQDPFQVNLSDYEVLYGVALSRYGEVMTPPPIYIEPIVYSEKFNVEITGLDYPEDEYARIYAETVRPRDLMIHSVRKKSVGRKKFPQETPEDFVLEWDSVMTRNPRLRRIEELRLERMFDTFLDSFSAAKDSRSFLVMDYEKCSGFRQRLEDSGFSPVSS